MGQAKLLVRLRSEAGRKYKRPISRTGTLVSTVLPDGDARLMNSRPIVG